MKQAANVFAQAIHLTQTDTEVRYGSISIYYLILKSLGEVGATGEAVISAARSALYFFITPAEISTIAFARVSLT